jgi:hypothetical protein
LTSARGRNILFFVRGRVDPEFAAGDFMPSAKKKFLSTEGPTLPVNAPFGIASKLEQRTAWGEKAGVEDI